MATCPSASVPQLLANPYSGMPAVQHCMPTYLPYVFYEASRSSGAILDVSIMVGVLMGLLVVWLDLEALVTWSNNSKPVYENLGHV